MRSVRSDNHLGGRIAAEHLWQLGYRKSVFLGPIEQSQRQFHERYEGFVEGINALGGEAHVIGDLSETNRFEQGREAIARLEQEGRNYDSIFAACDFIALGALEALSERGISVPEQVGIVGYDGIAATKHANPPLDHDPPRFGRGRAAFGPLRFWEQSDEEVDAAEATAEVEEIGPSDLRLAPVELLERSSTSKR